MFNDAQDMIVRRRAFDFLDQLTLQYGDVLPRDVLARGFDLGGERIHIIGPAGIFKPRTMQLPLTVTTSPNGPYNDDFSPDGLLSYRYRGTNPNHPDNVGLREIQRRGLPLIYFHGARPGSYVAQWPVFVISDQPEALTFGITFDERSHLRLHAPQSEVDPGVIYRRRFTTAQVRRRLHQQTFRIRVLHAYKHACALCRLRHTNLLEAAHIIPDSEEKGEPIISNGLAFCKLHHAAYDSNILGITPDYVAEIREDIMKEIDGPMLQHGLKEMDKTPIFVPHRPHDRPNRELLEVRYQEFKTA